ncbi:MAG: DUF3108 domain-containing protein [Nitrospinae bacterium]|nr:DUF3108 domain-containing protein [Nitrospinota bacterium]
MTNTIYAIELPEESLHYDISFLWFKNAAEGKITFAKGDTDNNFTAVLEAETLGFIGFITGYRKYIYISHLSYDGELKRLISTKFERIEIVGSKVWKSVNVMDYYTYKLTWKQLFMEKLLKETVDDIPPGIIYEDILSALFNLRLGFSQHIEKGKDYVIKGVPGKGVVDYFIHVSSPEEEIDRKNKLGIENEDGYLLLVQVPKIIFKSKGTIWIWFTKDLLPTAATVEDAVIFGNITGILRDRVYQNNEI